MSNIRDVFFFGIGDKSVIDRIQVESFDYSREY